MPWGIYSLFNKEESAWEIWLTQGLELVSDRCIQKGQSELSAVEKLPVTALTRLFSKFFSR